MSPRTPIAPCRSRYKFASWWGGQAGSLLLWAWLLSLYSAIVVFQNRRKFRDMMPWTVAILMSVQRFFLLLIAFVVSPFEVLRRARASSMSAMARD